MNNAERLFKLTDIKEKLSRRKGFYAVIRHNKLFVSAVSSKPNIPEMTITWEVGVLDNDTIHSSVVNESISLTNVTKPSVYQFDNSTINNRTVYHHKDLSEFIEHVFQTFSICSFCFSYLRVRHVETDNELIRALPIRRVFEETRLSPLILSLNTGLLSYVVDVDLTSQELFTLKETGFQSLGILNDTETSATDMRTQLQTIDKVYSVFISKSNILSLPSFSGKEVSISEKGITVLINGCLQICFDKHATPYEIAEILIEELESYESVHFYNCFIKKWNTLLDTIECKSSTPIFIRRESKLREDYSSTHKLTLNDNIDLIVDVRNISRMVECRVRHRSLISKTTVNQRFFSFANCYHDFFEYLSDLLTGKGQL